MPTQPLNEEQALNILRSLPESLKQKLYWELAREANAKRAELMDKAQARLRVLAAKRGLNWDNLNDEQRLQLMDDLVHEEHECE